MEAQVDRITKLAQNGVFGGGKFLRVIPNPDAECAPQFASQLMFLIVEFEEESKIIRMPIVAKIQPKEQIERIAQNSDNQFFVEVSMYSKVMPFLGASEISFIPKFLYGEASQGKDPDSDIVIMEDLSSQGYVTAPEIFLDADTIKLTMRSLGEFHGYSYRAKRNRLLETQTLGRTLPMKKIQVNEKEDMALPVWDRGFNAAKKRCDSAAVIDKVRSKMNTYRRDEIWKVMRAPTEPFAAIIHGDFNRNNLMLKYTNKKAEKVKFLDFQSSLYADPAVDIAFFLYMNSSQETRSQHWDDFFKTYWDGLISIEPNPGFSFEEFLNNFAVRAIYAYLPCSFFLPIMLETEKINFVEHLKLNYEEKIKKMTSAGGEAAETAVADIVLDLLNRGFLQKFVDYF